MTDNLFAAFLHIICQKVALSCPLYLSSIYIFFPLLTYIFLRKDICIAPLFLAEILMACLFGALWNLSGSSRFQFVDLFLGFYKFLNLLWCYLVSHQVRLGLVMLHLHFSTHPITSSPASWPYNLPPSSSSLLWLSRLLRRSGDRVTSFRVSRNAQRTLSNNIHYTLAWKEIVWEIVLFLRAKVQSGRNEMWVCRCRSSCYRSVAVGK